MSIRHLKTFVAVAKYGTFGATAEAIGLTHSAVSLQIKALESELLATLFDRTKRPPILTEHGRIILEQAQDVIARYDQMSSSVSEAGNLAGRLVIGAVPSVLSGILPIALRRLQDKHPRLRVEVSSARALELCAGVEAGEFDAVLVPDPVSQLGSNLKWQLVATEPLFVVAPADFLGSTDTQLLEAHPYIRFSRRAWTGQFIDHALDQRGIKPHYRMELDSMEAITNMILHGLGVSVLPRRHLENPLLAALKCIPFGDPPVERQIGMIERRSSDTRAAAALFEELKAVVTGTAIKNVMQAESVNERRKLEPKRRR